MITNGRPYTNPWMLKCIYVGSIANNRDCNCLDVFFVFANNLWHVERCVLMLNMFLLLNSLSHFWVLSCSWVLIYPMRFWDWWWFHHRKQPTSGQLVSHAKEAMFFWCLPAAICIIVGNAWIPRTGFKNWIDFELQLHLLQPSKPRRSKYYTNRTWLDHDQGRRSRLWLKFKSSRALAWELGLPTSGIDVLLQYWSLTRSSRK